MSQPPFPNKNANKNQSWGATFKHAIQGIFLLVKTEKNARIHLIATFLVILMGILLKITVLDWLFLAIAVLSVWITEALNTALENVFDLLQPNYDPRVKIGKDISAAAVLMAALLSVIIGVLILGPPLLEIVGITP
ncbi:MAG: diacylglycerol kinase family protein [Anaerolineaceae bacterium]|nr:diacylglycerol kinase family protein [Anaerolineaceae bacterium]